MLRWKKVPSVIRWTFHAVDLHEAVPGDFSISWQRGDSSGQTDPMRADPNHRLLLNAHFECACKLYVDKKTGQPRPKKIKVILTRHLSASETKVYGNLPIEVGQYMGAKSGVTLALEMESGRDHPPTLHVSISIHRAGEEVAATTADSWDQSFMEETPAHVPLAAWDTGADPTPRKASGDDDKRRHRRQPDSAEKPIRARVQSMPPGDMEVELDLAAATVSPLAGPPEAGPPKVQIAPEKPAPAPPPPAEDIVRRKPRKGIARAQSTSIEAMLGRKPAHEPGPSAVEAAEPAPVRETVIETPQDFLRNIVVRNWPEPLSPPQFLPGLPYPSLVFPLFAGLLHQKLFDAGNGEFEVNSDLIVGELERKDLAPKQKFFTLVALFLLVTEEQSMADADRQKILAFSQRLRALIDQQSLRVLQSQLAQTDVLVNRFATAVFHLQHLLKDFRDVTQLVRRGFKYGDVLNRFLMNLFLSLFERKLVNKLLQNPARFNFQNAVIWNSLVNAYENDERVPLPLLREAISGLMMAANIAKDPSLIPEICPSLPPIVCVFFCKHFHPDETVTHPINCAPLLQAFKLTEVPAQVEPFPMVVELDFKQLAPAAALQDWCRFALGEPCIREAPFLKPFARPR
jgi:hypothetical protein